MVGGFEVKIMPKKLSEEEVLNRCLERNVKLVGEYTNTHTKTKFECPFCGKIFVTKPYYVFYGETKSCGCYNKKVAAMKAKDPKIRKKMVKSYRKPKKGNSVAEKCPEVAKEWHPFKNPNTALQVNYGSHDKVWWICRQCNYEWRATLKSRTLKNSCCPKCKESKGEKEVAFILEKYIIKYQKEKRFDDCRNKYSLSFDFYLPDYNCCIEFNGRQHYNPVDYFGGEQALKKQQTNDQIKKDYCKTNKIKLLIIPHSHKQTIEQIIVNKLGI